MTQHPSTPAGLASDLLLRYNELAGVLAGHVAKLLSAAGRGDESSTRLHRAAILAWCNGTLEPTLMLLLDAADRIPPSRATAAGAIASEVDYVRAAVRTLATEKGDRRVAVSAIRLRVGLHRLLRAMDEYTLTTLAHAVPLRSAG